MKPIRIVLLAMFTTMMILAVFAGGVIIGMSLPVEYRQMFNLPTLALPGGLNIDSQTASRDELFTPFWQAWDLVHEDFVEQPVDDEKMMQGAIRGMMDSLDDPHTSYMDPNE